MNKTITILFLVITLSTFGQKKNNNNIRSENDLKPKQYLATRDSIIKETIYGSIYITKDTTAEMYSWLANETIDTIVFNEMFTTENVSEFLKTNKIKMKHFTNNSLKGNWSSLYLLNGKFYVYSPSDWMFNKQILVTDSAFYHLGSDDWRIESIQGYESKSNGDLTFNLTGYNGELTVLSIRFIDNDKNIALWHRKSSAGVDFFEIRVRSAEVRKFDMIVNDCLGVKCFQEFIFETPEYNEIIKLYVNTFFNKPCNSSKY
ncbi:hypothetical protein [Flavobacterium sp.]|uniref:hypothetical protein n=1 Tax=Flavobacterium sp. TaxID=239 RepID=UPI001B5FEA67|nr:hypothetical protein [Flavobacterium sp.]MBP6127763.1 hypothetical protein [Flavobacterium sp.]